MGVAGLLVGRLADSREPRVILAVGLASLALVGYVFSFVTPLTTTACLVLLLVWMRVSIECIFPPLNVAALRTLPEAHVAMGSGVLHVIMGIGAAVGTAGTASLLGYWTHLSGELAAFQHIFLLIALLYLATIVPALLIVPPMQRKRGGLSEGKRSALLIPSRLLATETGRRSGNESRGAGLRSPDHPLLSESLCASARRRL